MANRPGEQAKEHQQIPTMLLDMYKPKFSDVLSYCEVSQPASPGSLPCPEKAIWGRKQLEEWSMFAN